MILAVSREEIVKVPCYPFTQIEVRKALVNAHACFDSVIWNLKIAPWQVHNPIFVLVRTYYKLVQLSIGRLCTIIAVQNKILELYKPKFLSYVIHYMLEHPINFIVLCCLLVNIFDS